MPTHFNFPTVTAGKSDGVLKVHREKEPTGTKETSQQMAQWRHNVAINKALDEFYGVMDDDERNKVLFSTKNVVFPAVTTPANLKSTFPIGAKSALFPFENTQQVGLSLQRGQL
jgi:hypothetical protein